MLQSERVTPPTWYDPSNNDLVLAVARLQHKERLGRLIDLVWWPILRPPMRPVFFAICVSGLLSALFLPFVATITLGCYVSVGAIASASNHRSLRQQYARLRDGFFGYAVMWDTDVEWGLLKEALQRHHFDLALLIKTRPQITPHLRAYLVDTLSTRRGLRRELDRGRHNDYRRLLAEFAEVTAGDIHKMLRPQD